MTNPRLAELTRTFRLPSGLGLSRPRPTTLTGPGRALVVVAVLLVGGAIASGVGLASEGRRQAERGHALVATGVITTGHVTRLRRDKNNNRVAYTFVVDGTTHSGERSISRARRESLTVGAPIDVRYVPTDPRIHDLGGRPSTALPIAFPWVVASGLMAMAAACLVTVHRQRALLTDGRPAPAVVTGRKKEGGPHGAHWSITYDFALMNGAVVSGKSSTSKNGPNVGATFCVIYDPDRPSRNRAYPFSLVRAI